MSQDGVYVIRDLKQLRALADPLRLVVVQRLRERPKTISAVAASLGEKPNKLYYHFNELERLGVVRVVETRQKGNLVEKYYHTAAQSFTVDRGLFYLGPKGLESVYRGFVTILDAAATDLQRAISAGRLSAADSERSAVIYTQFRLTPKQAAHLQERLRVLCEEVQAMVELGAPLQAALTVAFYTAEPEKSGGDSGSDSDASREPDVQPLSDTVDQEHEQRCQS